MLVSEIQCKYSSPANLIGCPLLKYSWETRRGGFDLSSGHLRFGQPESHLGEHIGIPLAYSLWVEESRSGVVLICAVQPRCVEEDDILSAIVWVGTTHSLNNLGTSTGAAITGSLLCRHVDELLDRFII
jgi:hypothetical protein